MEAVDRQPNQTGNRAHQTDSTAHQSGHTARETYNHWSVVNLVFHHLAAQGLHPVLGEAGNPGTAAAELLRTLGIEPAPEGNRQVTEDVKQRLAELRSAAFDGG